MAPASVQATTLDRAYGKAAWHIVPLLGVAYAVSYLDRVNVGFAKLQMSQAVGFSETIYGFGAGAFFITYVMCQLPANWMLQRLGARRWIATIMITWGLLSATCLFVSGPKSFLLLRMLLGAAEAGFYPAMIYYLATWFPAHRRAAMLAIFISAIPIAGVIGNPLSGWILDRFDGRAHLGGWQWMFALEAAPAILIAIAILVFLRDSIDRVRWLTEEEKAVLTADLAIDQVEAGPGPGSLRAVLHDSRIYLLSAIYFSIVLSQYAVTFWIPTLLRSAGSNNTIHLGLLGALPFLAAVIAMNIIGRSADRHRERRWHTMAPMLIAIAGLIAITLVHGVSGTVVALCFVSSGALTATATFWSLPTAFLSGSAAGYGLAVINSIGNLGGFVSPFLIGFILDRTHHSDIAMYALAAAALLGVAGIQRIPSRLVNR
ncbi:MAG: MFS transporter [Edaphobacter sp.]